MKLIFIHGMPGVGKFTVGRELSELTGFGLFHNHQTVDLVSSLFEFGSEPFIELREKIWLEVFSQAVKHKLPALIFTFAYDRTVSRNFIENVRRIIEDGGGAILFVELKSSPEELEKRIVNPSRQEFGKLSSLDQFRELNQAGAFVDPGIPADRLVIETTSLNPSETAAQILTKLKLEL